MISPVDHLREKERLLSLESFNIMDTLPEEDYDNLTAIAAQICGTPISLISLLDDQRQWFKSNHGLDARQTPREYAFCAHAINEQEGVFIIPDSREDIRFHDNPLVVGDPRVIFYAGIPLLGDDGLPLGTLCVIDQKPKDLNPQQIDCLKALAQQVMNLLYLRRTSALLAINMESLKAKNDELEQFAHLAAHDLKSPLNNIGTITELFTEGYAGQLDDEGLTMLSFMNESCQQLKGLIEGLLEYSKSDAVLKEKKESVDLQVLGQEICNLFAANTPLSMTVKSHIKSICINRAAISQILINLVGNAVKYNDKEEVTLELCVKETEDYYEFQLKDNGPGICKDHQESIFEIFKTLGKKDRFGTAGNGIGLATVKKLTEKMGGSISVASTPPDGSTFSFQLEKGLQTPLFIQG